MLHLRFNSKPVRQLCIQPTGGGKTLVFHTLACYMKGISIYIIPFLSLSANQVNKAMLGACHNPPTWVVHLDDLNEPDVLELLTLIKECDAATTIMLYSSPHYLAARFPGFVKKLIKITPISLVVYRGWGADFISKLRANYSSQKSILGGYLLSSQFQH